MLLPGGFHLLEKRGHNNRQAVEVSGWAIGPVEHEMLLALPQHPARWHAVAHTGLARLQQASPGCSRPPAVMLDPTCWCDLPRHPQGNAAVQHTSQCLAAGCHSHGAAEGLHRVCPHAVSAWHHKHSHLASRHCMAAMACQLSWACMPVYVGSAGVIVLCNRAWHVCRLQGEQGRGHRRCHF